MGRPRSAAVLALDALPSTRGEPLEVEIDWTALLVSVGLLGAAAVLVALEIFVVSFGLLLIGAVACAAGSIRYAFAAHDAAGWASVAVIPLGAVFAARWGLARIRSSRAAVPKSEVAADAGYRHVAERLAVGPGSQGVLVTPARPSGRARFAGGECDVQVRGLALESGAPVVVERIDGPIVFVTSPPPSSERGEVFKEAHPA